MEISVSFVDGRTEVVKVVPKDLVIFERKYGMAAANMDKDPRVEYVMFLAFTGLRRTGRLELSVQFDDFLEQLDELPEDTTPANPLPPPV